MIRLQGCIVCDAVALNATMVREKSKSGGTMRREEKRVRVSLSRNCRRVRRVARERKRRGKRERKHRWRAFDGEFRGDSLTRASYDLCSMDREYRQTRECRQIEEPRSPQDLFARFFVTVDTVGSCQPEKRRLLSNIVPTASV